MDKTSTTHSVFKLASAILMILMLLWLTVSTPFIYQSQTKAKTTIVAADENETESLPSSAAEEKSESGASSLSEYLHDISVHCYNQADLVTKKQSAATRLYTVYHPELLSPPPEVVS